MFDLSRRGLMASSAAAALGASVAGTAAAEEEDTDTPMAPMVKGDLERFAWTALGAEVTGPEVTKGGTLFFSLQHPSRRNPAPYNKGGIGYVRGYDFTEGSEFDTLGTPETKEQQGRVKVGSGEYVLIAQEGDNISENEDLAMPLTPSGLPIDEFPGSRYAGDFGYNPDCNRFITTNEDETEGYLYSNWEESPGSITRIPLSRNEDGSWESDLANAENLMNDENLRELGGTRINCYGDISPWGTYLSAEEEYSHPRTAPYAKVSDFEDDSITVNKRGAAQFYNRPNPSGIQEAVDEYYGEDSWYVQGYWATAGLELQAYYLGAEAVDTPSNLTQPDEEKSLQPIEGPYPNPYRYGYIVDFREPTADEPEPIKYYVMGRAAWECPDVQADRKTVYLTSDGDNKGFYKFVADEPIPSYDDPMDVAGSLYVAKVTNKEAAADLPPYEAELELDWLEMGHATNRELAEKIAEFDDVDQVCYLEDHAQTDWREDLETALEEADRAVVDEGNKNYIPPEDIVEWARQWEQRGPKGVDDDLKHIPFLEARAAAKEIGGTVEFRKSEGIDSQDEAAPGEYVYVGISEVNTGMSDDEGDVQVDRVDGGLVYRAQLETDYNISRLSPVIVGPDATDTADVANSALINIDNVFVLEDGRVLCCEDADQYNRTYPNDCLYVYTPPEYGREDEDDDGDEDDGNAGNGDGNAGNGDGENGGNAGNGNGGGAGNGNGNENGNASASAGDAAANASAGNASASAGAADSDSR